MGSMKISVPTRGTRRTIFPRIFHHLSNSKDTLEILRIESKVSLFRGFTRMQILGKKDERFYPASLITLVIEGLPRSIVRRVRTRAYMVLFNLLYTAR